jgi:hypothetical protein
VKIKNERVHILSGLFDQMDDTKLVGKAIIGKQDG